MLLGESSDSFVRVWLDLWSWGIGNREVGNRELGIGNGRLREFGWEDQILKSWTFIDWLRN